MLLSVITVSFNSVDTIKRCLESIVPFITDEIEYIVYDGKSVDGTHLILNEYSQNEKIKWMRYSDDGIYDAMNKAVSAASGLYVCFVNSDDYLEHSALNTFVRNIKASKNEQLLVHGAYIINNNVTKRRPIKSRLPIWLKMPFDHQATLVERDFFIKSGGYKKEYGLVADYEFFLRHQKVVKIKLHQQYTNNLVRGGRSNLSKSSLHINLALKDNGFNFFTRSAAILGRKIILLASNLRRFNCV